MITPRQYEEYISQHFSKWGYKVDLTPNSNDYGVDIFVSKGEEKIAVQVKMYGYERKINRQMILELHGAKDYFDCSKAIIATDGSLLIDAIAVAEKLNIEILYIPRPFSIEKYDLKCNDTFFENIWTNYIFPLQGKKLKYNEEKVNIIQKIDWTGIERISSNGKTSKIKIFKWAINSLFNNGYISRDQINQNYIGRASSIIILILSQVPFFQLTNNPKGLSYNKSEYGIITK